MLGFREFRIKESVEEDAMNQKLIALSAEVDKLVDDWVQQLKDELVNPNSPTQRGLWDRFKNTVANLWHGRYNQKDNPYFWQNKLGDDLGAKHESFTPRRFTLSEYQSLKDSVDLIEKAINEDADVGNLKIVKIIEKNALELKQKLKQIIVQTVKPTPTTPLTTSTVTTPSNSKISTADPLTKDELEPIDHDVLKKIGEKLEKPKALWGKHVVLDEQEINELEKIVKIGKNKSAVVEKDPNWLKYQNWEKTHGKNLLRLTWPNKVIRYGGNIDHIEEANDHIILPNKIYKTIELNNAITGIDNRIQQFKNNDISDSNHPMYGTDVHHLQDELKIIANYHVENNVDNAEDIEEPDTKRGTEGWEALENIVHNLRNKKFIDQVKAASLFNGLRSPKKSIRDKTSDEVIKLNDESPSEFGKHFKSTGDLDSAILNKDPKISPKKDEPIVNKTKEDEKQNRNIELGSGVDHPVGGSEPEPKLPEPKLPEPEERSSSSEPETLFPKDPEVPVRKRGRPPGSKNKKKSLKDEVKSSSTNEPEATSDKNNFEDELLNKINTIQNSEIKNDLLGSFLLNKGDKIALKRIEHDTDLANRILKFSGKISKKAMAKFLDEFKQATDPYDAEKIHKLKEDLAIVEKVKSSNNNFFKTNESYLSCLKNKFESLKMNKKTPIVEQVISFSQKIKNYKKKLKNI